MPPSAPPATPVPAARPAARPALRLLERGRPLQPVVAVASSARPPGVAWWERLFFGVRDLGRR